METPVFEEIAPKSDCDCPGCVHWRRVIPRSSLSKPAARRSARGALALAAAVGTVMVLGVGQAMPAAASVHAPLRPGAPADDDPPVNPQGHSAPLGPGAPAHDDPRVSPQGHSAPLHGPGGAPVPGMLPTTTRSQIIKRAKKWIKAEVPYSMDDYWSDGYRQDCSGFVSMAWNLGSNEWTGSLDQFGVRISKDELQPGDILLFHNPDNPEKGSHVVIFGGWTDYTHDFYIAYEETPPVARRKSTPYAYWSYSDNYVPYRYKGIAKIKREAGSEGAPAASAEDLPAASVDFPGAAAFGAGADNAYVTRLGELLGLRGGDRFYATGPGSRWSAADARATQAFQMAQGWTGQGADGLPGPATWAYLMRKKGKDIPSTGTPTGSVRAQDAAARAVPAYPGPGMFRPGADNPYVTRLGRQLTKKGFGIQGPGSRWGEPARRSVEAFQRAQGWQGPHADGFPGPETWRRLFS
ncbi:peptidoglycan-binding protein [Streptomyces yaanensis]|uniref:Peptidoglycan-binding protein n=1 Tax=Streptomyces yaanensis TaxID=1142239 RepID=A0ABV7SLG2_9ACTN|nr:peptidoglycan-binding protein [Streptomyces sp. CGMCC 4.7035]WNC02056.1 peptidoglycan-binding protein [Streptomyces sp. CGMCC 4.7035]